MPNYSNMVGTLAAGAISNAYYPSTNRNGPGTTFGNAGVALALGSASALIQEFIIPHFTPAFKKQKQMMQQP